MKKELGVFGVVHQGTKERDRIGLLQGLALSLLGVMGYLGSHSMKRRKGKDLQEIHF